MGGRKEVLSFDVPVGVLKDGFLSLPSPVSQIMVDVGLSFNAPNSIGFLRRNPTGLVLAFEPNPLHYFTYFAAQDFADNLWLLRPGGFEAWKELRRRRKNKFLKGGIFTKSTIEYLPRELRDRFIFFPVAVVETEGVVALNIAAHNGSSSLSRDWLSPKETSGQVQVTGIRLDSALKLVPVQLGWLSHLKVDVEGLDEEVLRSAGDHLNRFVFISVEDVGTTDFLESKGFQRFRRQRAGWTFLNKAYDGDISRFDIELRV